MATYRLRQDVINETACGLRLSIEQPKAFIGHMTTALPSLKWLIHFARLRIAGLFRRLRTRRGTLSAQYRITSNVWKSTLAPHWLIILAAQWC